MRSSASIATTQANPARRLCSSHSTPRAPTMSAGYRMAET